MDSPLFPELGAYHLQFELRERRHGVLFTDQLGVHILELPKFTKPASELVTPLDRWLYFLCHGEQLDPEVLPPELDQPEIHQALEVLQAMNQSAAERERYEARQKYQHDMATWFAEARDEGIKQGQLIGRVHLCERLLHRERVDVEPV